MTLQELQAWVKNDWEQNSKLQPSLADQLLFAIEEFGEVAEAIRKRTLKDDYKIDDNKLGSEFGDLMICLVTLANTFDVDLTKEIQNFQTKLQTRRASET